ncbi:MAG: phosphohydrolase [Clostridiales bacterium]|nr:phosphohydrolase [Clostridiales bacterium]
MDRGISRAEIKTRYEELKTLVVNRKEQFKELIRFMENETAWLISPASTRFHLYEEGGLLHHSVNVADTILRVKACLAPHISDESCVVVALLHDLGKAGMPGNPQYIVNEPSDKQKMYGYKPEYPYRFNQQLTYLSVPVRSVYLISKYMELTEEEVQAIIYHDGQYVEDNRSVATHEEPLTLLLQYADSWSGFVLEK